eukprot:11806253-Alexandrium_andersonii.AAC.1
MCIRDSFFNTLGPGPSTVARGVRSVSPIDPGWHKKGSKRFPTMMTAASAEGEPLRFSAYQYSPASL